MSAGLEEIIFAESGRTLSEHMMSFPKLAETET